MEEKREFPAEDRPRLERRGHARPREPQGCARAKSRCRRGSPTPDTPAAGWEAQETPGPLGTRSPPAAPIQSRPPGPGTGEDRGLPRIPGERLPRSEGCNRSGCPRARRLPQAGAWALPGVRGVRSPEKSRPGGRGSGARGDGSGHGESRAEDETLPGAPDWGGGGYGARVGGRSPLLQARPCLLRANHQPGGGFSGSHPPPSP